MEIEKSASVFDIKQGEASVLQSNQNLMRSYKALDSAGVSNCYTKNGKIMAPNRPVIEGRDEIMQYISQEMRSGIAKFDLRTIKIWGDSTILAEEGVYESLDKKGKQVDKGKYLVLWKQEAGNWKMYRDIRNSDLPATELTGIKKTFPKN